MKARDRAYAPAMPRRDIATIAVIGLGYVGLPLAITAAKRFGVIGFDIDEVKIAQLERRDASFLSEAESAAFTKSERLHITADPADLARADAYIICVPTPVHGNHLPDLGPLESAAAIVGKALSFGDLVVVESTVNPGVCEEIVLPILKKASGLQESEFSFAHCPERINPGDDRWNVLNIPRVIGANDEASLTRALGMYRSIIEADLLPMHSLKEAEAVKMVENSFRDINIAFVNELAMSFDKAKIDIVNVIRGASTKPFGFMAHFPGCGVGGHCIPIDPYYLIRYGRQNGFEHHFLKTARRINSGMPHYTVRILADEMRAIKKKISGSTIALLGLSYKANVGDLRESPALEIRDILQKRGATVRAFDPHVAGSSGTKDLREALHGARAAIVATDHEEFRNLTPRFFEECGVEIVIDGRNCLSKDAFRSSSVRYRGIGRSV